jgi:hypothetical protein
MSLGRISGQLLQSNLTRNGVDLDFRNAASDTPLLFFDASNNRLGVNKDAPGTDLDLIGNTLRTTGLLAPTTNQSIANYTLSGSNLNVSTGDINFNAAEAIVATTIETDNIRITDNTISTFDSNASFDLTPNGTGIVDVLSDMKVFGNLDTPSTITMGGSITIGDNSSDTIDFNTDMTSDLTPDVTDTSDLGSNSNYWSYIHSFRLNGSKLEVPNLKIDTNVITTLISNSNLDLRGNASGNVKLEDLEFATNVISTSTGNNLTLASATTLIDTTTAFKIPGGTTVQRPNVNASIRFNSNTSNFEGYFNGNTIFGGVYSDNAFTNVVAHPTNDTIGLTVNNNSVGTVASTGITLNALQVDNININGNIISTATDTNLVFAPAGTSANKSVKIDNLYIGETVGTQQIKSSDSMINFNVTGFGSNKFPGSYAVTIPSGTTAQRPGSPQLGDTRWNTETNFMETYNGSNYISAAGSGSVVTRAEYDDILLQYTILLG